MKKVSLFIEKSLNTVSYTLIALGAMYVLYALYMVFFGHGEAFGFLHASVIAGMTLDSVKGADKVKKLPFDLFETKIKAGKKAYGIRIPKDKAEALVYELRMLCTSASVPFFAWPSKNVNSEGKQLTEFVTYGTMPKGLEIVSNYQTLNLKTAKEVGDKIKSEVKAEREAKKEAKKADKGGASAVLAKIAAIEAMKVAGEITALEAAGLIAGI